MASSPITQRQIDGETMETAPDFILGASKITADGDCSHEIKIHLLLGRKAMTHLDSIPVITLQGVSLKEIMVENIRSRRLFIVALFIKQKIGGNHNVPRLWPLHVMKCHRTLYKNEA